MQPSNIICRNQVSVWLPGSLGAGLLAPLSVIMSPSLLYSIFFRIVLVLFFSFFPLMLRGDTFSFRRGILAILGILPMDTLKGLYLLCDLQPSVIYQNYPTSSVQKILGVLHCLQDFPSLPNDINPPNASPPPYFLKY